MSADVSNLRHRLLRAAEELIAIDGGAAVSLRSVARRAGASHAAPGHHFGDKRGMLTAVATSNFSRFADHLETRIDERRAAGRERLTAAGVAYVEFAAANWSIFEFMYRCDLVDGADADYVDASARSYSVLVDAVAEARADGWAPQRAPDDLVRLCWAAVHGLAALTVFGGPDTATSATRSDDTERLVRELVDALDTPTLRAG